MATATNTKTAQIVAPSDDEIRAMVPADLQRRIASAVAGLNKATSAHEKAVLNLRISRVFIVRAVEELSKLADFRKGKNQTLNKGRIATVFGYSNPVMSKFYRGLDAYSAIPVEERNTKSPTEAEIDACNKGFDAQADIAKDRRKTEKQQPQVEESAKAEAEPEGKPEVESQEDVSLIGDLLAQVATLKKNISNAQSSGMTIQAEEFEVLQAGLLAVIATAEDMVA